MKAYARWLCSWASSPGLVQADDRLCWIDRLANLHYNPLGLLAQVTDASGWEWCKRFDRWAWRGELVWPRILPGTVEAGMQVTWERIGLDAAFALAFGMGPTLYQTEDLWLIEAKVDELCRELSA